MTKHRKAIVLGAGIQGTCASLALANGGWDVTLIDRLSGPLLGTSQRGEGKLHLGYVYANDPGRRTAALMAEGSTAFADLINGWLGEPLDWPAIRSEPFLYAVMADTLVGIEDLSRHYAWVDGRIAELLSAGATYAGRSEHAPVAELPHPEAHGLGPGISAAFATSEVAVPMAALRGPLQEGLARLGVQFRGDTTVTSVGRKDNGFTVSCTRIPDTAMTEHADAVVNCLWDGRLAIDATMGIEPTRPWSYRLKYAVHGTVAESNLPLPSTTLVLGPYGDVVRYQNGSVYASWYPECVTDWSSDLSVPESWRVALAGQDSDRTKRDLASRTVDALVEFVPGVGGLRVEDVAAGVVVAWGVTDIDEATSELHRRDMIGLHEHDGYLSVDTGKLTTAPLFASRVAEMIGR